MKKSKGFTLIELLVVISIMLIFIGSTIAQYNNYTEQTKLRNEAKKLVDVLELAKKKALSADLVNKSCINFTGYRVNLAATGYSLIFCCDAGCSVPPGINVNTYAFNNANITTFSGTGIYIFPPLMNNPTFVSGIIRLKNSSISTTNKCINISISSIGIVELDETLVGC